MYSIASQITSLTIVYSTIYSGADQRTHKSSASLAFVRGNHRIPVNSPHKRPVTRKMLPFDDVIICIYITMPWWGHDKQTLTALPAFSKGNPPVTLTKGKWCEAYFFLFFCCYPCQIVKQTVDMPVIWDAIMMMGCLYCDCNRKRFDSQVAIYEIPTVLMTQFPGLIIFSRSEIREPTGGGGGGWGGGGGQNRQPCVQYIFERKTKK